MKIGILTFHCAHNYGAVLQAYATQTFLQSQGFEVVMVDYRPEYLVIPSQIFPVRSYYKGHVLSFFKVLLSKFLLIPASWKRYQSFNSFINRRFNLIGLDQLSHYGLDALVLGSDQIWNPVLCKGFDPVYFGCIGGIQTKKIVYAASMGHISLQPEERRYLRRVLTELDKVSVREKSLKELLSPLSDKSIELVVDPTLLLGSHFWGDIAVQPSEKQPYVLVYEVIPNPQTMRVAKRLADRINGKIIELKAVLSLLHQSPYQFATPEEFLGYFRNAAFVVTTSFHGTVFSLIFNRPFYTMRHGNRHDARSEALLDSLMLKDRLIMGVDQIDASSINYKVVNQLLEKYVNSSKDYLISSLRMEG